MLLHPVHVTLTTIDQVHGADTMNVHFRMYYDDFLRDFELYDKNFDNQTSAESTTFPVDLVNKYFNDKVHLYVNNKLLKGKVLMVTIRDNEIFLNLSYRSDIDPRRIKVSNKILTGLYSDQTNMVFIKLNKNEQAMRLTPDHDKETWSFDK